MSYFDEIVDAEIDASQYKPKHIYNIYIKRIIDLVIAIVLAAVLWPVFILIAIMIKATSRGSMLYRGERTGRYGELFRICKFRTMIENAENVGGGTTALNDNRITSIGKFLRKTKLDEIPQLINILNGTMSFIGPRPELPRYTDQYQGIERIILDVRPGITDMSSIKFINLDEIVGNMNADETYEKYVLKQKNQLRVQYVLRQSLLFDTWLFCETVWRVIRKALRVVFGMRSTMNVGANANKEI